MKIDKYCIYKLIDDKRKSKYPAVFLTDLSSVPFPNYLRIGTVQLLCCQLTDPTLLHDLKNLKNVFRRLYYGRRISACFHLHFFPAKWINFCVYCYALPSMPSILSLPAMQTSNYVSFIRKPCITSKLFNVDDILNCAMPRGTKLTEREKGQIEALSRVGVGLRAIGRELGRTKCVVKNFFSNPERYGAKKRKGRKRKLSKRDERQISKEASNSTKSANDIKKELKLEVSFLGIVKMNLAPRLLPRHKESRLKFARENMGRNWKTVIFSDEKKFNLDGPDGLNGYWRDLRKEPLYFSKRNFGGGSVMVWAGVSFVGSLTLQFTSSKMKSRDYIEVLNSNLVPYLQRFHRLSLTFQQDNASIHVSKETKSGLMIRKSPFLTGLRALRISISWKTCGNLGSSYLPQQSPVWKRGRARSSNHGSVAANSLEDIQKLVDSIPNRIFQVINRSGGLTDY
uniref:Tc3 transposase DNA binding domain-containing protein n=1 Tax=Ditylenchus dipsaci TaxID=166011 RepID=A0A915E231_9BILA